MTSSKTFFKSCGLISTLGNGVETNIDNLRRPCGEPEWIEIKPKDKAISAPYFPIADPGIDTGPDRIHDIIDRAVDEALAGAGLTEQQLRHAGLFVGSTSFDIHAAEHVLKAGDADIDEIARRTPAYTGPTRHIVDQFQIRGPVYTFNTACTSSANALMYAAGALRRGDINHALVVGLELFNEMTVLGFSSLELLSRHGMRPFATDRDGLVLGEACGAVILTRESTAHGVGLLGGANLADNYSVTACNPDGSTVARVIKRALHNAGVTPRQIELVKAHGTASPSNDEAEARGLQQVFEEVPPVTLLKPMIGHTLGACGIVELILFYRSLIENRVPVFGGGYAIDEAYRLRLVSRDHPVRPGCYLLNYFAFGGNNTALVIDNA